MGGGRGSPGVVAWPPTLGATTAPPSRQLLAPAGSATGWDWWRCVDTPGVPVTACPPVTGVADGRWGAGPRGRGERGVRLAISLPAWTAGAATFAATVRVEPVPSRPRSPRPAARWFRGAGDTAARGEKRSSLERHGGGIYPVRHTAPPVAEPLPSRTQGRAGPSRNGGSPLWRVWDASRRGCLPPPSLPPGTSTWGWARPRRPSRDEVGAGGGGKGQSARGLPRTVAVAVGARSPHPPALPRCPSPPPPPSYTPPPPAQWV